MAYKRILIWEQNWLGDVLFSTPFIRALRKKFKDAYIAVIVDPSCKEILEGNAKIDDLILYDEENRHRTIMGKIKLIAQLKKKNFDAAFLLHRSLSRAIITEIAGIPKRIGYFYKKRNFVLTDIVDPPDAPLHKIEYFLGMARYLGCDISDKDLEFPISESDRSYINEILRQNSIKEKDPFVVINPGANWEPKRWPEENFAELSDRLSKAYKVKIVISGAEKDIDKALRIQGKALNKLIILCGKTTLKQLGALFEKAKLVISGDSGPLHIALAVRSRPRVIALFGPTSPKLTGPYGSGNYRIIQKDLGCEVPCYDIACSDNRCMKMISIGDVMEKVRAFI